MVFHIPYTDGSGLWTHLTIDQSDGVLSVGLDQSGYIIPRFTASGNIAGAGGLGQAADIPFLTLTSTPLLSTERILTPSSGIIFDDLGANNNLIISLQISSVTTTGISILDSIPFQVTSNNLTRKTTAENLFYELLKSYPNYGYRLYCDFDGETTTGGAGGPLVETNSGTGAASNLTTGNTNRPGVIRSTTGTTATGRAAMSTGTTSFRLGNGPWSIKLAVNPTTLSTVTERYQYLFGFINTLTAANQTNAVYFLYDEGAVSTGSSATGNWQTVTVDNSVRTFNNATVPTAVAAGSFVTLRIEINSAATAASFYVDNVLIATHSTNIPTAAGREVGIGWLAIKSIGLTARTFNIDYINAVNDFTTTRL